MSATDPIKLMDDVLFNNPAVTLAADYLKSGESEESRVNIELYRESVNFGINTSMNEDRIEIEVRLEDISLPGIRDKFTLVNSGEVFIVDQVLLNDGYVTRLLMKEGS